MKRKLLILLVFTCWFECTLSIAFTEEPLTEEPLIIAYYYPWYVQGDWSRHDYVGTPVLGKYGTDSTKVAQQHIDWCADHGIDGLFVSWWGRNNITDKHLKAGLLKSANLERIRYGLYYESLGILDATDGKQDGVVDFAEKGPLERMIADFKIMAADHFDHPQYLKFNGRPVVGFYVSRTFKNFSRKHLEQLNEAIGHQLYAIADEAFFWEQALPSTARNGAGVFDAYSAYNLFEPKKLRDDDTALTFQSREVFPIFRDWAAEVPFFPGVMPSYHDFRGHPTLAGTPEDFATILDAAWSIAKSPEPGVPPMIFVTSFNEWWEGTTIEPADEYGSSYLEVIRNFKDLLSIENEVAKVGIDRDRGGAITWLSSSEYPKNIVNLADPGRLIQQSYYAGKVRDRRAQGQSEAWSPWSWNPIQGGGVGSWARVSEFKTVDEGRSLYSETIPKLWDMPNEEADARMRQWTSFEPEMPNVVVVQCEFVSMRDAGDPWGKAAPRQQEIPACYFTRNFSRSKSYLGDGKWRDETQAPGPPWGSTNPPRNAMALFEANGQGIALFSPCSTQNWNFGPHGEALSDDPLAGPCMHVAPLDLVKLEHNSTYRFRYWLIVGDETSITAGLDSLWNKYSKERAEHTQPESKQIQK